VIDREDINIASKMAKISAVKMLVN